MHYHRKYEFHLRHVYAANSFYAILVWLLHDGDLPQISRRSLQTNNKVAPRTFSKNIDYRDFHKIGDFKYIREINRHQHLTILAKVYYVTGDQTYKDEIVSQIKNWIKINPFMKGLNWICSFELCIQLISWSWIWFFLGELDPDFQKSWVKNIYEHCTFLSKNFSRHSSANNSLIGEATGLFIASLVWSLGKKSVKWRKKNYSILIEEMEKQTYSDGVNKEQSVSYHQVVVNFFILAGLLRVKNENTKNEIKCIFNCGPLGYISLASHGHADALSFIFNVGEREIFVDPGTHIYQYPEKWRRYFKGISAHDTAAIDRVDQFLFGGSFMWLKKAENSLLYNKFDSETGIIEGEHNGYSRLKYPVIHKRKIVLNKITDTLIITDQIEAKDIQYIEQFFHLSEHCSIEQTDVSKFPLKNNNKTITIELDAQFKTQIHKGSTDPMSGWKSDMYDVKKKIFTLINYEKKKGSCEFENIIKTTE